MTDPRTGQPLPADAIRRVLYSCKAVHVYAIPPLTSMKGYEAASWTTPDPQNGGKTREIFTARLRVLESAVPVPARPLRTPNRPLALPEESEESEESQEVHADIVLEDGETGELFAAAPYVEASVVEHAIDSSRFFAVRVEGEGKKAMLGVGFEEKSDAFDFGVALQEARKILGFSSSSSSSTTSTSTAGASTGRHVSPAGRPPPRSSRTEVPQRVQHQQQQQQKQQQEDYSLKPGESVSVKPAGSDGDEQTALFSLPPPPASSSSSSSSSSRRRPPASTSTGGFQ